MLMLSGKAIPSLSAFDGRIIHAGAPLPPDRRTEHYFHGVRVFHVRGEQCLLAVERVVKL